MESINTILIKKASGEEEAFSTTKLERSLVNAGANAETVSRIVSDIKAWITPGTTTKKIYSRAFSSLRHEKTSTSIRYKLKQAILELGPSGYPFETLIGQLFEHRGYSTEVGVVVEGKCVTHEMDVIATKELSQHLVECKYHKDQGKPVSIQVPLYVRARVDDIIQTRQKTDQYKAFHFTGWVITNTRFSNDSIQYGNGAGLQLLAWDYPHGNGLKELIEKYKIYPITILSTLTSDHKQALLKNGVVTCTQLMQNRNALNHIELTDSTHKDLFEELKTICN